MNRKRRDLIPRDDKFAVAPRGFNNIGATCWFNAIVQTLLSSAVFNRKLMDDRRYLEQNKLARLWIQLVEYLQSDNTILLARVPQYTHSLLSAFTEVLKADKNVFGVNGTGNQCADEGLVLFISAFKHEPLTDLFYNVHKLVIKCPNCEKIVSRTHDKQIQHLIITDQILPPKNDKEYEEAYATFMRKLKNRVSEMDEYLCEMCNVRSKKIQRVETLFGVRELILIYFHQFYTKETHWFPQAFFISAANIENTVDADGNPARKETRTGRFEYRVVGQTQHSGNQMGGHYWAQGLRSDGKFHKLNDNSVSAGSSEPHSSTFIVLYELYAFHPEKRDAK